MAALRVTDERPRRNDSASRLVGRLLLRLHSGCPFYGVDIGVGAEMTALDEMAAEVPQIPRGIRNKNPGNIVRTDPRAGWAGAVPDADLTDPRFEQFTEAFWGLRALAMILLNYQKRDGCATLGEIINRWAPPVENDTSAYTLAVCSACGVTSSEPVDLLTDPTLHSDLVAAIVHQENGMQPYAMALIARACDAAAGHPHPVPRTADALNAQELAAIENTKEQA